MTETQEYIALTASYTAIPENSHLLVSIITIYWKLKSM